MTETPIDYFMSPSRRTTSPAASTRFHSRTTASAAREGTKGQALRLPACGSGGQEPRRASAPWGAAWNCLL